jgi:1,4-alpha-glucan branching enzyme
MGAPPPFTFFTDVGEDRANVIREGRATEFAAFPRREGQHELPDPMAKATFRASKLDWTDRAGSEHAAFLDHNRRSLPCGPGRSSRAYATYPVMVAATKSRAAVLCLSRGRWGKDPNYRCFSTFLPSL